MTRKMSDKRILAVANEAIVKRLKEEMSVNTDPISFTATRGLPPVFFTCTNPPSPREFSSGNSRYLGQDITLPNGRAFELEFVA